MTAPSAPDINPLNPTLYSLLVHKFGEVRVANPGAAANVRRIVDPTRPGRVITQSHGWGEYYCVCCPFCNDVGHRLWINHLYGAGYDNKYGRRKDTFLACCYKNNCLEQPGRALQLENIVFGPGRPVIKRAVIRTGSVTEGPTTLELPGRIVSLNDLPADHIARQYLTRRGFDVHELASVFRVGFCVEAMPRYRSMVGRIFIPSYFNQQLVSWQGRLPRETQKGEIKYYTQGRKSQALYNYDIACTAPAVILMEGAPSVWRVGPAGVCLFGKTLSYWQENTIATTWAGKPVFVLLDSDARKEVEGIVARLWRHNVSVVPVFLPDERDPANYSRMELRDILTQAAAAVNVVADLSFLE